MIWIDLKQNYIIYQRLRFQKGLDYNWPWILVICIRGYQHFSVESHIVNILGFAGHIVSATTIQLPLQ